VALIVAFEAGILCGTFLATRRKPAEHSEDEHAQWPGADAGFSNHGQGV
jgi:hypothetical protein